MKRSSSVVLLALGCLLLLSCFNRGAPSIPAQREEPERVPSQPVQAERPPTKRVSDDASRLEARRLQAAFDSYLEKNRGLSYDDFLKRHRPEYLAAHNLDVSEADYYDEFVKTFQVTDAQQGLLRKQGFVVLPSPAVRESTPVTKRGAGPADIFYRVFAADLPVFVSADSILHAWHRSYDQLMEQSEEEILSASLSRLLTQTMEELDQNEQAGRDALTYLAVSRKLLEPTWEVPEVLATEVQPLLAAAMARRPAEVQLAGETVGIDFTQLIPRGHYTHSESLTQYFQAMMWLGRTDLVLYDPARNGPRNPREEAAARAMVAALHRGNATAIFRELDDFYRVFVGSTNAVSPLELLEMCEGAGVRGCAGENANLTRAYRERGAPAYSGRMHSDDRGTVSMRFFPQRFGYDSWVTARTTTPELAPPSRDDRSMASPLDVAFVLGADRAAEHYAEEMQLPNRENLPATLEALRMTMADLPPTTLDDTVYNHWLEALMALSRPHVDERFPRVMRTGAWHDRKLETVLGSWAELRHDTILVLEQSMGGAGCQYPQGYVEPVPDLYRSLASAAARLAPFYEERQARLGGEGEGYRRRAFRHVPAFLAQWREVMGRLAGLAELQLAGREMSEEELAFLNRTVDQHRQGYMGARSYDGWYPALFWSIGWLPEAERNARPSFGLMGGLPFWQAGMSEPVVADVHTDADSQEVLSVGVGHPELLVVAIDDREGEVGLYGGPVYSFRSFHRPITQRMTDNEWEAQVNRQALPPRPGYAQSYRAHR